MDIWTGRLNTKHRVLLRFLQKILSKSWQLIQTMGRASCYILAILIFGGFVLTQGFNPEIQMPFKAILGSSTTEIDSIGGTLNCNEQRNSLKECATECYSRSSKNTGCPGFYTDITQNGVCHLCHAATSSEPKTSFNSDDILYLLHNQKNCSRGIYGFWKLHFRYYLWNRHRGNHHWSSRIWPRYWGERERSVYTWRRQSANHRIWIWVLDQSGSLFIWNDSLHLVQTNPTY